MGFTTIKTKHLNANGIIVGGSARLKSVYFQHGASVGTLTFKDGATAGTTFLTINTMADKGEKIKDQGFVPYAKTKTQATSKGPKPGAGKGKSRGGGEALRGTKFTGVF